GSLSYPASLRQDRRGGQGRSACAPTVWLSRDAGRSHSGRHFPLSGARHLSEPEFCYMLSGMGSELTGAIVGLMGGGFGAAELGISVLPCQPPPGSARRSGPFGLRSDGVAVA